MDAPAKAAKAKSAGPSSGAQKQILQPKSRSKRKEAPQDDSSKRRCVSTACIACRKRKSKCDGNLPACAACSSVYYTECVYDPNSDHRRKGVYRGDKAKTRNTTLEVIVQSLLNTTERDALDLLGQLRACESLDTLAEKIMASEAAAESEEDEADSDVNELAKASPSFENQFSAKMGELRMEDGNARFIGGTSNLLFLNDDRDSSASNTEASIDTTHYEEDPITSWSIINKDPNVIKHLLRMYFTWHYPYFATLSRSLFLRDFHRGYLSSGTSSRTEYCTPLLVNAMLALGCHFTALPAAREDEEDSATAGDHFFKEAKRLIMVNEEYAIPRLATVQALALMSVREAGCGREAKGWVYSGMSFRMACDLGLNLDSDTMSGGKEAGLDEEEVDARRMTFWGCFLFDKCWSNYLGRLPQLPMSIVTVPKFDVFPNEDAEMWCAYTDSGPNQAHAQPCRNRAVALQISKLCEISGDLMTYFYNPTEAEKTRNKQIALKKLSDIHQRLETWRRNLPVEMEPKEGGLPSMLVMHMFFQLLYIHLFRPFLKYTQANSPLPANVSPRRLCTQAAAAISKLLRLYKRSHGLRQICNIAVYIAHSANTIHLLNLPDKNAKRDITHGVKHLEEIAESWLCARRTLTLLGVVAKQWEVELPEEAAAVLERTNAKYAAKERDIKRRPSEESSTVSSPDRIPVHQITKPSPNFFTPRSMPREMKVQHSPESQITRAIAAARQGRAGSLMGSEPSTPIGAIATPVDYHHRNSHHNPHSLSPSSMLSGIMTATGGSSTSANGSNTNGGGGGGGPAAPEMMLRADGGEWWFRDQNQLAQGFAQWSAPMESSGNAGWPTARPVPVLVSGQSAASMEAGGASGGGGGPTYMSSPDLAHMLGVGHGGGTQGMTYPDESDWYQ